MIDESLFERVAAFHAAHVDGVALAAARNAFEAATGAMVEGSGDFDARMAHYWEYLVCTPSAGMPPTVAAFAQQPGVSAEARGELAGWLRSHRTLFSVVSTSEDTLVLRDLWGQGVFDCGVGPRDRDLAPGDRFDARLVAVGRRLWLSPGRVFYDSSTHAAVDTLLLALSRTEHAAHGVLDSLLRMRSAYLRFESIRPEHVFRADALDAAANSASWARRLRGVGKARS